MNQHRFVIDVNVGRLAKWLRVLGYDTVFPRHADDNDLVRIALREGRVLVTRDVGISLRRAVRQGQLLVVQILNQDLNGQLRQLVRELGLELKNRFSRCLVCNETLHSVTKEKVADREDLDIGHIVTGNRLRLKKKITFQFASNTGK